MHYIELPEILALKAPKGAFNGVFTLPASKSLSNRLLIMHALSGSKDPLKGMSKADDTLRLQELISTLPELADCGDGGTTIRFLLAYYACKGHAAVLTGTDALLNRPIAPLVDALRSLGADISYLGEEGKAPLRLSPSRMHGGMVEVDAAISSQFISALLLIAPSLEGGLKIRLKGVPVSASYINTTLQLLPMHGAAVHFQDDSIVVPEADYQPVSMNVSADWSAASYVYALAALRPGSMFELPDLRLENLQPDEKLAEMMSMFGVLTESNKQGVTIRSGSMINVPDDIDLSGNPDLAPTFAVLAALLNVPITLTGLSTLKNKESNRMLALQTELQKCGVQVAISDEVMQVKTGLKAEQLAYVIFDTYQDHRMAMAFSLFSLAGNAVQIRNPKVVGKSFPDWFSELQKTGFEVTSA